MSLVPRGLDPIWDRPSRFWDIDRPSRYWDIDRPSRFWELERPSRLWDIDDWFNREVRSLFKVPDYVNRSVSSALQESGAQVNYDKDKFEVNVDVQQFAPHEISVKTSGNTITVEGKHEERNNGNSYISKNLVRQFVLPQSHDVNQAISNLSTDGVLTITAPRIVQPSIGQRTLPIIKTGLPSKAITFKT